MVVSVPVEERRLRLPHLTLAARVWGHADGFPVLALHGWLDNAASFDTLAALLPDVQLVAIDLVGHGHSDWRPPGSVYHFVDYIPDVLAAADALGWEQFGLLGHSLGAGIASFLAAIAPERVTRLAMIEGLGPRTSDPADGPAHLREALSHMRGLVQKNPPLYPNPTVVIRARAQKGGLSREAATLLVERSLQSVPGGYQWRTDPRLRVALPFYFIEPQILAYLSHIQAPSLLICGTEGYLVQRHYMQERYAQLANLQVHLVSGKHHVHLENPVPCAALLAGFLRLGKG